MRRLSVIWVCTLVVLVSLAFQSHNQVATADAGSDATIAALQTQVAAQATTIAKYDAKISQLRRRIEKLTATEVVTSSSTLLGGTAFGVLPAGTEGTLEVVTFAPVGATIAVLVRNNTGQPVAGVDVSGVGTDADGQTFASSQFPSELKPYVIQPGGYGVGSVTFNSTTALDTATFTFTLAGEPLLDLPLATDLDVVSATYEGGMITGELVNASGHAMYGPVVIAGLCFDQSGAITGSILGFADNQYEIDPDEHSTFSVKPTSGVDCSLFVVAGGGTTSGF